MKLRSIVTCTAVATAFVCLSVPFNMGGCADDVSHGIGQATGQSAPAGTDNYIRAGEKALKTTTLNEADEDAMGQSVAMTLTSRYGLNDDETLARYVNLVGLTVASATPRPDGNWVFGVINSSEVNAYAGPNGYILITKGALAKMQDEAELAGVLAHECAHVANQDGLNAVKNAGYLDAGMEAGKGADQNFAKFGQLTDGVVDVVIKKGYSRDQEMTADVNAVKFLVAAGYDPNSYLHFLQRVKAAGGGSAGSSLMSTHPGLDQRIAKVSSQIKSGQSGATLKDRFVQNVKP